MTCMHCGQGTLTMEYTLRCTPDSRVPQVLDLHLCTDCLRELCAQPDIELVSEQQFRTAD